MDYFEVVCLFGVRWVWWPDSVYHMAGDKHVIDDIDGQL